MRCEAAARYCKETELGRGGAGVVYAARDIKLGKRVALKEPNLDEGRDPQSAEAIIRSLRTERNFLEDFDHANIVTLEDSYPFGGGQLVLVLELLLGGDLALYIDSHDLLDEARAKELCVQMLRAVAYLHSMDIVHRDLKAENFAFADKDCKLLKLVDFGEATVHGSTPLTDIVGTHGYMAPEVASGQVYTEKCDMWSLGVIAFMLLTRRKDVDLADPNFTARSQAAQDFVKLLLTVNQEERMGAEEALAHLWLTDLQPSRAKEVSCLDKKAADAVGYTQLPRLMQLSRLTKADLPCAVQAKLSPETSSNSPVECHGFRHLCGSLLAAVTRAAIAGRGIVACEVGAGSGCRTPVTPVTPATSQQTQSLTRCVESPMHLLQVPAF